MARILRLLVILIVVLLVSFNLFDRSPYQLASRPELSFIDNDAKSEIHPAGNHTSPSLVLATFWKTQITFEEDLIHKLSRSWNSIDSYRWCVQESNRVNGIIYVKTPKAASSTFAGINFRIAKQVGRRVLPGRNSNKGGTNASCNHVFYHGTAFRNREPPFLLWTSLRDPGTRAMSILFFFEVARRGLEPTSENMIRSLERRKSRQLAYVATQEYSDDNITTTSMPPADFIQQYVMNPYQFIALVERMEESLVVMKLLWGLSDEDVIVLSAKQSGNYDDGKYRKKCNKIPKAYTTPQVDEYLRTNYTNNWNYDYLLYAVANRSLDLTIDALGRERVEQEVETHKRLQQLADDKCLSQTIFPCSANGTRQVEKSQTNCYYNDFGCGFQCVDNLFQGKKLTSSLHR
jgi:hypothetical protein